MSKNKAISNAPGEVVKAEGRMVWRFQLVSAIGFRNPRGGTDTMGRSFKAPAEAVTECHGGYQIEYQGQTVRVSHSSIMAMFLEDAQASA